MLPNIESFCWPATDPNTVELLLFPKLSVYISLYSMLNHYELSPMKDFNGMEEIRIVSANNLLSDTPHFLRFWSEGNIGKHLRLFCLKGVEALDDRAIEALCNFKTLISLKLGLKNATKVKSAEEALHKIVNSLPLVDAHSPFELEQRYLGQKMEPRKMSTKRRKMALFSNKEGSMGVMPSLEKKFALVSRASVDLQFFIAEKLIMSNYFVFAMKGGPVDIPVEKLVEEYGEDKVMIVEGDSLDEESLVKIKKMIEQKTDHLDLLVNDQGIVPSMQLLLKDMNEQSLALCYQKHVWGEFTFFY